MGLLMHTQSTVSLLNCVLLDEHWQVLKGRFAAVNSFLISCRCRYAIDGPAPAAHLGDGCADLVVIHRCSRLDYTKHLYRCSDPRADQVQSDYILRSITCQLIIDIVYYLWLISSRLYQWRN